MKMKFGVIIVCLLLFIFYPTVSFAHPGRTASDGCHYCRTNCAKWGEVENARHCHGGGSVPQPPVEQVLPPPTTIPTRVPTRRPTVIPTKKPLPTVIPTSTPKPTSIPVPTGEPTVVVTETPTSIPTLVLIPTETPISPPTPTTQPNTLGLSDTANAKVIQNKNIFSRFFSWLFRGNY